MENNFQIALKNPGIEQWVLALMAYQIRAWVDGVVTNTKEQMDSQKKQIYNQEKN